MTVIKKVIDSLRVKDIRKRIFFTLGILVIFRVLAAITTPGIPQDALQQMFGEGTFGDLMTTVSGAAFKNASVIAIGLGPYINASVILQLLGSVVPALEQLQQEGERGRKIINQYTRFLTVPLSILQSFVIYSILRSQNLVGVLGILDLIAMIATMTAGSMFLVWLGELIQESGVGNGSSVIIFAGIMASLPGNIAQNFGVVNPNQLILIGIGAIAIVAVIVFFTEAERKIKVQYAKRARGRKTYGGGESYIPLRINTAGVMPVIFAVSLLSFPRVIARFFLTAKSEQIKNIAGKIVTFLNADNVYYFITYFVLIMLFCFFYTFVIFKPEDVADNLKKSGGFIPGIRPGKETAEYLFKVLIRLTTVGSIFLAFVAILPTLVQKFTDIASLAIGGTSLLIIISVILDILRQVESMSVTRSYEKYR